MTVLDYFTNVRKIDLRYSADLPCINVGRPKRPTYFPIEVNFSFTLSCVKFFQTDVNCVFAINCVLAV
jgi:hypothetical protein